MKSRLAAPLALVLIAWAHGQAADRAGWVSDGYDGSPSAPVRLRVEATDVATPLTTDLPLDAPLLAAPAYDPFLYGWAPNDEWCRATRVYRSVFLGRLYFEGEYLGWATKGQDLPPLVTTSAAGTPVAEAGVIGPGTTVLFGDQRIHNQMRSGGRLTLGYWWTPAQLGGVQASYFELDGHKHRFHQSANADTILARPFAIGGVVPAAALIAYPGVALGGVDARTNMQLSGAEVMLRRALIVEPGRRVDLLVGYRYNHLGDFVGIEERLISLDAASGYPAGAEVARRDHFQTKNHFHGAQVAVVSEWWGGGVLSLELTGKAALGGNRTLLTVDGVELVDAGGVVTVAPGGVLTGPSNLGRTDDSSFAFLSELGVRLIAQLTCQVRGSFGYSLLHWTDVGRTGPMIDTAVGGGHPVATIRTSSFWAQGLNFGFEYQF